MNKAITCCVMDDGRPIVGGRTAPFLFQKEPANRLLVLWSKAMVLSEIGKDLQDRSGED